MRVNRAELTRRRTINFHLDAMRRWPKMCVSIVKRLSLFSSERFFTRSFTWATPKRKTNRKSFLVGQYVYAHTCAALSRYKTHSTVIYQIGVLFDEKTFPFARSSRFATLRHLIKTQSQDKDAAMSPQFFGSVSSRLSLFRSARSSSKRLNAHGSILNRK